MLHHIESGSGAEATVWLHGILGTGQEHWDEQLAYFEGRHLRPDLLMHGASPDLAGPGNPAQQNAAALLEWMDALGLGRVHLVGASMGADAALTFALAHPERVLSLTLVGLLYRTDAEGTEGLHQALAGADDLGRNPEAVAYLSPRHGGRNPGEMVRAVLGAYLADPLNFDPAQLAALQAPVLLVQGDQMQREVQQAAELRFILPQAQLAVLPNAGHFCHLDDPGGFIAARQRFLKPSQPAQD